MAVVAWLLGPVDFQNKHILVMCTTAGSKEPAVVYVQRMNHRRTHAALVVAAAVVASSCMPSHSRLQPYRNDAAAARSLAQRAAAVCTCLGRIPPPHAFTTDGCSISPDGSWAECCVEHDIAYWCGGSSGDRRAADERLRRCMTGKGRSAFLARIAHLSVRGGGVPWKPFPWRWAYGWDGLRGYEEKTTSGGAIDRQACFAAAG